MSRTIEREIIQMPAHWASCLINGDLSGLSNCDIAQIEGIEQSLLEEGWRITLDQGQEPYFAHDIGDGSGLAGDVLDFTMYRVVED